MNVVRVIHCKGSERNCSTFSVSDCNLPGPLPYEEVESIAGSPKRYGDVELKMALFGITREYIWIALPLSGYLLGRYFDNLETERMTLFRDKSALYGRVLQPGEKPSWP